MARFYGEMTGSARTTVSRQGSKENPVRAHVRGWDLGIKVRVGSGPGDEDIVSVYLTSGSNDTGPDKMIGYFNRADYDRMSINGE